MQTIILEETGKFVFTDTPEPERPAKGEATVRIRNIGICGTDLHAYRGKQPFFEYPRILGHELSAEVVEPNRHSKLKEGMPVVVDPYLSCGNCIACRRGKTNCCQSLKLFGVHIDGGMREYLNVPVDNLLPAEGLEMDQMATVECLNIGAHAVRRAELEPGETVAVVGTGPIGIGVIAFAKIAGARVIAVDINEGRLSYCRDVLKVDATVNALDNPVEALEELTQGDKPSVVFEVTGNKTSMENSFQYVSHGGQLILVGLVKDSLSFDDPHFHKHELSLKSSRNGTKEDLQYVIDCIRDGKVDTESFITHRCAFNEMISRFDSWLLPQTGVIKAMVELS
jgi:2-desacetyl-2-hydroxyethyl bacteriochlorophyllide A dehydrogenase